MKYIHIILPSKRMMNTYVSMIRENFKEEEHAFIFLNRCVGADRELFKYGNIFEIPKTSRIKQAYWFYKKLNSYDCIVWHGLIYDEKKSLMLYFFRKLLKKSVWIIRGIDLYNYKKNENNLKNKIINYFNYKLRKSIPIIISIFPTDENIYRKEFGNKAKHYFIPYPIAKESFEEMRAERNSDRRSNGEIWILNGNNAYTFNNHIKILEKLKSFQQEKIKIIMPLSYGNDWYNSRRNYIQSIANYANEKFLHKYIIFKNLMPVSEYNKVLSNIDVAIIGSNRQNALGNILRLLYINTKVFLSRENPVYSYLKEKNVDVYCIEDIENMNFAEFIEKRDNNSGMEFVIDNHHPDAVAIKWKKFFDEISKSNTGLFSLNTMLRNYEKTKEQLTVENEIKKTKKNYLFLSRYILNRKDVINKKDIIIVGTDNLSLSLLHNIYLINKTTKKYLFKGFIGYDTDMLLPKQYLDAWNDYHILDSDYFICGIEAPYEREKIIVSLVTKGANFIEIIQKGAEIGYDSILGKGNLILDNTKIGPYCNIGNYSLLKACILKVNVKIGDFVIVKENAIIGNNVIVGNNVTIGNNVVIQDNVIIKDFAYIEDNSFIEKNSVVNNEYILI